METKINIATILKNKPKGTKLYSTVHGKCTFEAITDEIFKINFCTSKFGLMQTGECTLIKFGNMFDDGECIIFPSKEMQDWSKFAWKKGDILVSRDKNIHLIFEKFIDDTYTIFAGKHCYEKNYRNEYNYERRFDGFKTEYFTLETEDAAQKYLKTIEEKLGGKLNRETLEIEKTQSEFKDGDVLFVKCKGTAFIEIFNFYKNKGDLCDYVSLDTTTHELDISGEYKIFKENIIEIRLATEEEKQQLFDALEKKSKAWDSEKKAIVDLKPKCEFKPFDKVLGRNEKDDVWEAELFSHYREESQYPFRCIGFSRKYCIPYNEDTAHLLGTTDDWEGGEQ